MARTAVFVTESLPEEAKSILSDFEVFETSATDEVLSRCQVLMCWSFQGKRELLGKMTNLNMLQGLNAGVDGIDFGSLASDVQVFSNAGAFTEPVAEHAWGLLLGVAKGIHLRNQKTSPRSLRKKTLLVLGCGAIGSEIARLSKSLGMNTVGISRSFKSPELFDERHALSSLAEKVGVADAIAISIPLTKSTRGVVTYDVLAKAKEDVIIVNVGRGETVEEDGLIKWLKERPESRFVTDVYWAKEGKESFSTKGWDLPNFAGTLHVSGLPLGVDLSGVKVQAAWNVRRYFESGSALNHVDIAEYV